MKYSLDNIKDIYLHDYELKAVEIDYFNKSITIKLVSPEHEDYAAMVNGFFHFSVDCIEPWGAGMYIHSLEVLKDSKGLNESLIFEMLLNSGDKLVIHANEIEIESIN